jgi:hypothetical protein
VPCVQNNVILLVLIYKMDQEKPEGDQVMITNVGYEAYRCTCERCGHTWTALCKKTEIRKSCPECKSAMWNVPYTPLQLKNKQIKEDRAKGILRVNQIARKERLAKRGT